MSEYQDRDYCASSFLAFRYIYDDSKNFLPQLKHRVYKQRPDSVKTLVKNADEIDAAIQKVFDGLDGKRLGILLSGGMDSAILASYMSGCDAYTFRFDNGNYQKDELERARLFAKTYGLRLHYVDVSWQMVENNVDILMKHKGAPVHSIEPQIYEACKIAKQDGIEVMIIGDAADYVFYGMDGLLSKDWKFEDFYQRMIYIEPKLALNNPVDMHYIFEKYRRGDSIDFIKMYDEIVTDESYASYENAFSTFGMSFVDPYELLKMSESVDLNRIRSGDSKYLIRDLFRKKYPNIPVPQKNPMPRPVDIYFKNWAGPTNPIFRKDISLSTMSGNQKWLLWVLDRFLNIL